MKRLGLILASITMLFTLSACASSAGEESPAQAHDLTYDFRDYDHFAEIFEEKTPDEWDSMGEYTILLRGLHAPVTVDMRGMDVVAVSAFGQKVQLGADGGVYQGETPVSIGSVDSAVVVNLSWDYDGKTFILTKDGCITLQPQGEISTQVFPKEDGTLRYSRYWGEYRTTFDQCDDSPLQLCTSRDHFLYESGSAQLVDGKLVFTPEETVTVSDVYDLDALFAEFKAAGQFQEFETVDALLEANRAKRS